MAPSFICEAATPTQSSCCVCDKEFSYIKESKRGRRRTSCSDECRDEWAKQRNRLAHKKYKNCIVCGNGIPLRNKGDPVKTCSEDCRLKRQSEIKTKCAEQVKLENFERASVKLSCVTCSKEFEARSDKTKHCKACLHTVFNAKAHATRSANARARLARICQRCSAPFFMKRSGKAGEGKFCSKSCAADSKRIYASKAESKRAQNLRRKLRLGPQPSSIVQKPCENCGKFSRGKVCSYDCRKKIEARQRAAEFKPSTCRCRECKREFQTSFGHTRRKFCSDKCSRKHGKRITKGTDRARRRRAAVESVNPLKVFERDNWRCQLCRTKTPRVLRGKNQPTSPEMDHIIPLSIGGAHSYVNTQCLCRKCNGAKGATVLGQFRLFG